MNVVKFLGMIDVFPGKKTYLTILFAIGMVGCQMGGWHTFTPEAWGLVGINGALFYKMGQDRVVPPVGKAKK